MDRQINSAAAIIEAKPTHHRANHKRSFRWAASGPSTGWLANRFARTIVLGLCMLYSSITMSQGLEVDAGGPGSIFPLSFEGQIEINGCTGTSGPPGEATAYVCRGNAGRDGGTDVIELSVIQTGALFQLGGSQSIGAGLSAPFYLADGDPAQNTAAEATVQGIISGRLIANGLVQSFNNLGAYAAFGLKVELLDRTTGDIVAGYNAMAEGCSTAIPNSVESPEPCANIFANDVPLSFPVVLRKGHAYALNVIASCEARAGEGVGLQGVPSGCQAKSLQDGTETRPGPVRVELPGFTLSISPDPAPPELDTDGLASQESVNNLQQGLGLVTEEVVGNNNLQTEFLVALLGSLNGQVDGYSQLISNNAETVKSESSKTRATTRTQSSKLREILLVHDQEIKAELRRLASQLDRIESMLSDL